MGININDCTQDFTGQILRGEKTIETRSTRSLDPYIGERVGIVRTGVGKATLVGYATVGEPVVYDSVSKFRRDYDKHLVAPGSAFDMKDRLKYGYPLMQVESVEPKEIESRGIVARRVNPATPEDFPDVSSTKMRATPQTKTDAFKRWFDGSIVVNPDGTPMVMYHGTGWTDIGQFKSSRAFGKIAGHFAFDPEFASEFAEVFAPDSYSADEEDDSGTKKYATVYPVYLSLKKLFDVRKKEDRDAIVWVEEKLRGRGWDWTQLEKAPYVIKMKSKGFDGYLDFEKGSDSPPTGIAVFDPRTVKSATGNRGTFDPADPDIRNPYTRPDLRDRLKRKIMAGSKGGNPGQWSARKAQLLAAEYEKAGGGYTGGRSKSQQSLSKWTKQDWRTKSGKPALETGERYLPAAAIKKLSSAEYAATSRAKRKATGQFSKQPKRIAMKTKEFRNPMTSTVRKKLASVIEPDDRILCYDTASGEDFYRLWDIIHTNMPMTKEALVEVEGMLDDDGVLVIESGESPAGLQDHFRKATRYNGLLLVQGPRNPENARIETEKLRRELE